MFGIPEGILKLRWSALGVAGPNWNPFLPGMLQEGFWEHFVYVTKIADEGLLLSAGPWTSFTGASGVFSDKVVTLEQVEEIFNNDPWTKSGVAKWTGFQIITGLFPGEQVPSPEKQEEALIAYYAPLIASGGSPDDIPHEEVKRRLNAIDGLEEKAKAYLKSFEQRW